MSLPLRECVEEKVCGGPRTREGLGKKKLIKCSFQWVQINQLRSRQI